MRSRRVRLISDLLTAYTATFSPLYMANVRLDETSASDSFIDNVEKFPELFPTYIHVHNNCFIFMYG